MAGTPPTSGIWALPSGARGITLEYKSVLGLCPLLRSTGSSQDVRAALADSSSQKQTHEGPGSL